MTKKSKLWIIITCIIIGLVLVVGAIYILIVKSPKETMPLLTTPLKESEVQAVKVVIVDVKKNQDEIRKTIISEEEIKKFVESANAAVIEDVNKVEDADSEVTASYTFEVGDEYVELLSLVSDDTIMMTSGGWRKVDFKDMLTLYECFETSKEESVAVAIDADGTEVYEVTRKIVDTETDALIQGIDVSEHQGNINWDEVAASGVDYAIIRIGTRYIVSGEIAEDATARYNLQEVTASGIPVGAYFFSAATTEEEAIEEAQFVLSIIDGYPITYPVVYNCEQFDEEDSRQSSLTVEERSRLADVFLTEIENQGYTGMFYAAQSELEGNAKWNTSFLESKYRIWVAQYKESPDIEIETEKTEYSGIHEMWQYTANGTVAGIKAPVDMNVSYIAYSKLAEAKTPEVAVAVEQDVEVGVVFEEVNDQVTAKDEVNVRSTMEQGDDSNIIGRVYNGEVVSRTGIGINGWSRIQYNGEVGYVVSSYVTSDTGYVTP